MRLRRSVYPWGTLSTSRRIGVSSLRWQGRGIPVIPEVPVVAVTSSWGFQGGSWRSSVVAGVAVTVLGTGPLLEALAPSMRAIVSCRRCTSYLRNSTSVVAGWAYGPDWWVGLVSPTSMWLPSLGATAERILRTKVAFLSNDDHAMPRRDNSARSLGNVHEVYGVPPVPPKRVRLPAIPRHWTLGAVHSISDLNTVGSHRILPPLVTKWK